MLKNTSAIARAGVIAGLYVVLTLITFPIASTEIQFRPSEGLTLLALFLPESIPALFVGCMISNLITGCQILDVIFGGIITLVAGICTFGIGKIIKKTWIKILVGGLFPVLLNALLLPVIWYYCYYQSEMVYYIQVISLTISQSISVYAVGSPIVVFLKKRLKK
jgi:uncharacterized membrane protein